MEGKEAGYENKQTDMWSVGCSLPMATPGPFSGISWSTANHITLGVIAAAVVFPALSAIVRLVWYKELSSSPTFPGLVSKTIHASLENLFSRVDKLDLPALVVKRVLPKITTHIDQFRRSEIAVRGAGLERHLTQSDELDMLLASRYAAQEPLLKLHPAVANLSSMHTMQTEEAHLRVLVDAILPYILPEKETRSRA